jgi:hypothetical protein
MSKPEITIDALNMLSKFEKDLFSKHRNISAEKTPKHYVKRRPDGLDYVEESYMREKLNEHYPLWSWVISKTEFLGAEWCIVSGELQVAIDGAVRKFGSVGAARVQFKRGQPHTAENVIDIDKNLASANTNAFKRAISRLCNIADDVYRKHVEDVSLTDKQEETISQYLNGVDSKVVNQVNKGVKEGSITSQNFDATIRRLITIREDNNLSKIKES